MLLGLVIRDVVLIETLDLSFGPGLTALTGETGAGKSIVLGALGLAAGARGEASLIRRGAAQASATAIFALAADHGAWALLEEKGLNYDPGEDLVLRRILAADGRTRAFVNDQPTGVAVLRELAALIMETHGQHETVGLLDPRTHRGVLDAWGGYEAEQAAVRAGWSAWRQAREAVQALAAEAASDAEAAESLAGKLGELDRLDPRAGEEAALAEERALLGAAEKTLGAHRDLARSGARRRERWRGAWPAPITPSAAARERIAEGRSGAEDGAAAAGRWRRPREAGRPRR